MELKQLIKANRSYRKYEHAIKIEESVILEWIDYARFVSSSKNRQAVRFLVITESDQVQCICNQMQWARHLKGWDGPNKEQMPSALLIVCTDDTVNNKAETDVGIITQTLLLQAVNEGFGGCILRSINRKLIREKYKLNENLKIDMVVALGKPAQEIILEEMGAGSQACDYWEDENGTHHVPKRAMEDVVIRNIFKDKS
ncbi:MAG: nitroreductase family protein [Bacteroidales bacterium]|nr:nitroreductase family protein [Bacteroidales bacterium]